MNGRSYLALRKGERIARVPADTFPNPTLRDSDPVIGSITTTPVVLSGAHLDTAQQVWFGTVPAASFTIDSVTQITATPASTPGLVSIVVETLGGTAVLAPSADPRDILTEGVDALITEDGESLSLES